MEVAVRKGNPVVRILFSVLLIGVMFYYVRQQQPASSQSRLLPQGSPSEENSVRFAWVPRYPGAEISGIRTQRTADQTTYAFQFEIKGDFAPVMNFFESQLKTAGFHVVRKTGGEFGATLHAEDSLGIRWVDITAGKAQEVSEIDVTAVARNGV